MLSLLALLACSNEPRWILRTDMLAAGADCAYGGLAIVGGPDADGSDTLANGEVETREVICNGAPGAEGADTIATTTEEPAGDNCANGGTRVDSGQDDDVDGTLDPEEIDVTTYVCEGDSPEAKAIWYGDATVQTAADAAQIAAYDVILGSVYITAEEDVTLPRLRAVGGTLRVSAGSAPATVSLPSLTQANALIATDATLTAPALALVNTVDVYGAVDDVDFLAGVTGLGSLTLASATIGDPSALAGLEDVTTLSMYSSSATLDGLTSARSIYLENAALTAPALTDVTSVYVYGSTPDLDFLSARDSLQDLVFSSVSIADTSGLANLTMVDVLSVYSSSLPRFTRLSEVYWIELAYVSDADLRALSALRSIEYLYVYNNRALSDLSDISRARATGDRYAHFSNNPSLCDATTADALSDMGFTSTYVNNESGC